MSPEHILHLVGIYLVTFAVCILFASIRRQGFRDNLYFSGEVTLNGIVYSFMFAVGVTLLFV